MKRFLLFLFAFLFQFSFSQVNVNKAQKHIYLGQYYYKIDKRKSFEEYQRAFELNPHSLKSNIHFFTKLCFEVNEKKALEQAIYNTSYHYLFTEDYFTSDILGSYVDMPLFKEIIEKKIPTLKNNYYSNSENIPKIEFEKEIAKLDFADQYVRTLIEEKDNRKCLSDLMKDEDSVIISKLIHLTKKYGWNENARIILWHQRGKYGESNYVWDYFIPFFKNQIEKDLVSKQVLVEFEKNISMTFHTAFKYEYLPFLIYKLKDIQMLDVNRKSIGLPPLYFNKHISEEYKLPDGYNYDPKNLLKDLQNL